MNRYDMQDLIIEEEDNREKKPKKALTILALIIIILIVGMMIMKYSIGDEKSKNSDNVIKKEKNIAKSDSELAPMRNKSIEINPQKEKQNIEKNSNLLPEDELSEIMPIEKKQLEKQSEKKVDVEKTIDDKASQIADNQEIESKKIKEETTKEKKEISIAKLTNSNNQSRRNYKHKNSVKSNTNKKKLHKVHKTIISHKTRITHKHKASDLFKKRHSTPTTSKAVGVYYIQVGSFSKQPNKKYLENIKIHKYKYKLFKSDGLTKVRIGPYSDYEFAKSKLPTIKKDLGISGFVVRVK